jgi:hypothetical protein
LKFNNTPPSNYNDAFVYSNQEIKRPVYPVFSSPEDNRQDMLKASTSTTSSNDPKDLKKDFYPETVFKKKSNALTIDDLYNKTHPEEKVTQSAEKPKENPINKMMNS